MRRLVLMAVMAVALTGCGLRHVLPTTDWPYPDQRSLIEEGYRHDLEVPIRHSFWLETTKTVGEIDLRHPVMVVNQTYFPWLHIMVTPGFPWITVETAHAMRYAEWCIGPYCRDRSWSWSWFFNGVPNPTLWLPVDQRRCALQAYSMPGKTEGNISKQTRAREKGDVIEKSDSEQRAVRVKCDQDSKADPDNLAGY